LLLQGEFNIQQIVKSIKHSEELNQNYDLNKINLLNYIYSAFKQSFTNVAIKNTTTNEIGKIIKELKSKKSCGCDEITTKILKVSNPFIVSSPLTYICNRMLSIGTFPDRLKFSEIKPICKKGDKTPITNNRQISLLTVFSKIF